MILDLHRQDLPVSAIARRTGVDRKTVRKYIQVGLEPPHYGPRRPRPTLLDAHHAYLRERVAAYPDLSARRLLRELREFGYAGGYSQLTEFLRDVRPAASVGFERRFETPPGQQAQVDFAQFRTEFIDEPGAMRIVWLLSMVLGHSRLIWATFVMHQDLQAVLRCHVAAFEAIGGVPAEILYDRMRTAVTGEGDEGIVYNATLLACARHYGFMPRACRPYRAQSKGKVERPFRYTVCRGGKQGGSIRQAIPPRRTQKMALTISRIGHPGGRPTGEGGGSSGSTTAHSASVRSLAKRSSSRLCCARVVAVHMGAFIQLGLNNMLESHSTAAIHPIPEPFRDGL